MEGYGERWNLFEDKKNPAARFGGFLSAIVSAIQNWNDNSLVRMPGVGDRIERVRLNEDESGFNLDMGPHIIKNIVKNGKEAAEKLVSQFAEQPLNSSQSKGWNEQRFVWLCVLLKMLEKRSPEILNALNPTCAHATDSDTLIVRAMQSNGGNGAQEPLTPEQARALWDAIKALKQFMVALCDPDAQSVFRAIPETELRVRPPL